MPRIFQPFSKQALVLMCLQYKSFENAVGKGEIARNSVFYPFWRTLLFPLHSKLSSANSLNLVSLFGVLHRTTVFQLFNGSSSQIHVSRTILISI